MLATTSGWWVSGVLFLVCVWLFVLARRFVVSLSRQETEITKLMGQVRERDEALADAQRIAIPQGVRLKVLTEAIGPEAFAAVVQQAELLLACYAVAECGGLTPPKLEAGSPKFDVAVAVVRDALWQHLPSDSAAADPSSS